MARDVVPVPVMPVAVADAFMRFGLVLVQGQWELPSLADLIAGQPITTKGYSWDYVPAWELAWTLDQHPDFADIKLWRGKRTVVHRRHFPAIEALARASRIAILDGAAGAAAREMLLLIDSDPGITGKQIAATLGWDAKTFQKHKGHLAELLAIVGVDQEDAESHTHDHAWSPWSSGKIATAMSRHKRFPTPEVAGESLLVAAGVGEVSASERRRLLPVLASVVRSN